VAGSKALSPLEATYSAFGAAGAGVDVGDGVGVADGEALVLPQAASTASSATDNIAIAMVRVDDRALRITSLLTFPARCQGDWPAPKRTLSYLEALELREV
jgi:hypothetical protein